MLNLKLPDISTTAVLNVSVFKKRSDSREKIKAICEKLDQSLQEVGPLIFSLLLSQVIKKHY